MKISGLSAVVTGGHSGMGFAVADLLIKRGCKVAILGRRQHLLQEKAAQPGMLPVVCDVSDPDSVDTAMAAAAKAHGAARILVHAAAAGFMPTLLSPNGAPAPLEPLQKVITTNLLGTLYVNRSFAGRLTAAPILADGLRGVLINVSSISAADGVVGVGYAASKGGVDAIGLSLARELGPHRIRVVTISPGGVDTEMFRAGAIDGTYEALRTMVPSLGRAGRPEEFAALALHVCENDYLNGCNIRLDGGMRLPYSFDLGSGLEKS